MDGVNSMTGNAPDLRAFAAVAREHGALLYVDDAHGFGVIGERAPDESCVYGTRGNSVVRHCDESYDNVVLVGGFSKAYSSLLAFIACPTDVKDLLKVAAPPYLYSGPSPVASLATVLAGFDVNETRGDELRRVLCQRTERVLDCLARLRVHTPNRSGFPIVEIPLRDHNRIDAVGQMLFDRGVYVTLAAYPLVPKDEVGFRIQLTAANTDAEIDLLIGALEELAATRRAAARPPSRHAVAGGGGVAMRRGADIRRPALWQLYLGAGALLAALYVWVPPFAGSGPVFNLLGLSPVVAIVVGVRRYKPASRGPWLWFAVGMLLFWLGDLYTYSYPRLFGADVPFPSLGDGVVRGRLPGADGGPADARPAPQPGERSRRRHRLADHDARPRAAVVGRAHRALPARRDDDGDGQARLRRLSARRHPPAGRGHPPGRRHRQAPAGLLPARLGHRRPARHRLRLRRRDRSTAPTTTRSRSTSAGSASTCCGAPPRCTRRCASSSSPRPIACRA